MKCCYPFKARRSLVCDSPSSEQNVGLLSNIRIDRVIPGQDAKSLEKWLICESFLEPSTGILN